MFQVQGRDCSVCIHVATLQYKYNGHINTIILLVLMHTDVYVIFIS